MASLLKSWTQSYKAQVPKKKSDGPLVFELGRWPLELVCGTECYSSRSHVPGMW